MGSNNIKCPCGEGYASAYDGLCKFCREKTVSRREAKSVNVKHAGDGMSVTQMQVLRGEVNRKKVYL